MSLLWQNISVFLIVASAAIYLLRLYFKKKAKKSSCAYSQCDCKAPKLSKK